MKKPVKSNFYTVFFGIFALVGTITGLIAATVWFNNNRLTRDGVRAMGTVVELVGDKSKAAVVEFTTPYITNQSLQVLIDPNNPGKYYVDLAFLPEAG